MKTKQGLQEEYDKYVAVNKEDGDYSMGVINAGERVATALGENKSPEEAIEALTEGDGDELTGYMAGAAIQAVCHFHERGEELRIAWNSRYKVPVEQKGIVNPALAVLNDDGSLGHDIQPV